MIEETKEQPTESQTNDPMTWSTRMNIVTNSPGLRVETP